MANNVYVKSGRVDHMLSQDTTTTTVTGDWKYKDAPQTSYQGIVSGTGAVTATLIIEFSNDGVNPVTTPAGTITLSGTTVASDGFVVDAPWKFHRVRVTAISGTGAVVNCFSCV